MANTQTTEFYHSDDFSTIEGQALDGRAKMVYEDICEHAAELLNEKGHHEKFTVNPDFVNALATHELAEVSGVFLRSANGFVVECSFPEVYEDCWKTELDLHYQNK